MEQNVPSSNNITGFFVYHLWRETMKVLDFSYGDSNQGKIAYETATADWVWLKLILMKQLSEKLTIPVINTLSY